MKPFDYAKYIKKNLLLKEISAGISDDYYNLYIANNNTSVKNINGKETNVPKGTVISSAGGGIWTSVDKSISVGIESLEENPDFSVVSNMTWPNTLDLVENIKNWARETEQLIQAHPKYAENIIGDRAQKIKSMQTLINQ